MEKYYNIKDELQTTLIGFVLNQFELRQNCICRRNKYACSCNVVLQLLPEIEYHCEKKYDRKLYWLYKTYTITNSPNKEAENDLKNGGKKIFEKNKFVEDKNMYFWVKTPFVFSSLNHEEKEILLIYICENLKGYNWELSLAEFVIKCINHLVDEVKKKNEKKLQEWVYNIKQREELF
jgi:hypothetical protein